MKPNRTATFKFQGRRFICTINTESDSVWLGSHISKELNAPDIDECQLVEIIGYGFDLDSLPGEYMGIDSLVSLENIINEHRDASPKLIFKVLELFEFDVQQCVDTFNHKNI